MNPTMNYGQCTPGDETTCPDPENNGEVCPAVLPNGIIGKAYNQQFTIIAPPEYDIEGTIIPLHHIKIVDVKNLPPGITWETNASDSIFMVGTYYCVLLSGICNETGTFPLKIVVDVYIDFFGQPVYATQISDSTSISMKVTWDPDGIDSYQESTLAIKLWPNPFQNDIYFELPENDNNLVDVEIYSILGKILMSKSFSGNVNSNKYRLDISHLHEGTYLLKVNSGDKQVSKLIRKTP
jgi:hypothetical protein